jgi:hypothetical protein
LIIGIGTGDHPARWHQQFNEHRHQHVGPETDDLVKQVSNGAMKLPSFVEATYGASILEWVRQTYEGRLNFKGATSTVEDVTGRKPQTLEMWVRANRQAVLSAAS